ncbi:hypothetical protein ACSFA8_22470 [Variovorax sp. RT4R15]|uniref:hypothetical protein n=1 Tax=Variovorax sp. RT4R15 TaxID=3443737 RepID=UPI003F45C05E
MPKILKVVAIVGAFAALLAGGLLFSSREEKVVLLDPAQVVVLRTPGGYLEVATLVRNEEFRWRSSYTCLGRPCPEIFGQRIGTIRVPVHYTYRIPLADSWTLAPDGDVYVLSVPPPIPLLPPGLDTGKADFMTERGGILPPSASGNQANLLRNLGPELAERAQRIEYIKQQIPSAEKTVREFAERWMAEQKKGPVKPIRVEFRMTESS